MTYNVVAGSNWIPTGDQNSILSWQGSVIASVCGGVGQLNASKGAVFNATVSGVPTGGKVTFRFKFRDPAAKGKPNTNCLDASDPNRNKADVCGASWSSTKTDP
jgi:putative intracellular protease/amidase